MKLFANHRPIAGPAVGPGMNGSPGLFGFRGFSATQPVVVERGHSDRDVRDAYRRGRADEKGRHGRHPFLAFAVFLVALVGAALLIFAAAEGSFSRGGAAVDSQLAQAADAAEPAVRGAATEAGAAVVGAGAEIRERIAGEPEAPAGAAGRDAPPQSLQ